MRWPRTGLEALVMTGILAMPTPGFTDAARKTQYRLTLSSTYFRDPPPQPQPQNPPPPPPQQPAPRPPYLPPEEPSSAELPGGAYYVTPSAQQSDKPAYLQPAPTSSSPSSSSTRKGCGNVCIIVGGAMAVGGGLLLAGLYGLHKEGQEGDDLRSQAIREDEKATGPILVGIGTLAGLGIMIYGLATQ